MYRDEKNGVRFYQNNLKNDRIVGKKIEVENKIRVNIRESSWNH